MIAYKRKTGIPHPVPVECEVLEWPKKDADGETIYVNTHFTTEAEAWDDVIAGAKGRVRVATHRYEEAKKELQAATEELAQDAAFLVKVDTAFEDWKAKQESEPK